MILFKIFTFVVVLITLFVLFIINLPAEKSLSLFKKLESLENKLEDEIQAEEIEEKKNRLISFKICFPSSKDSPFSKIILRNKGGEFLFSFCKGAFSRKTISLKKELWLAIEEKILEINFAEISNDCEKYFNEQKKFLENPQISKKDQIAIKKELDKIKNVYYKIDTKKYFDLNLIPTKIIRALPGAETAAEHFDVLFIFIANLIALMNQILNKQNQKVQK